MKTKKIKMLVVETCTYKIDVEIPADAEPQEWVNENGEALWVEVDDINEHFVSCDERYLEAV